MDFWTDLCAVMVTIPDEDDARRRLLRHGFWNSSRGCASSARPPRRFDTRLCPSFTVSPSCTDLFRECAPAKPGQIRARMEYVVISKLWTTLVYCWTRLYLVDSS